MVEDNVQRSMAEGEERQIFSALAEFIFIGKWIRNYFP